MNIFSTLFKKKEKQNDCQQNVIDENYLMNSDVSQNNIEKNVSSEKVSDEVSPIVVEQSNVLEQMQNNFIVETTKESEEKSIESNPMSVFSQNITLDSNNPMAIFGVDDEDNRQ